MVNPVWWTGDGVPLLGSVESMVDSGVHDFKTYVPLLRSVSI